MIPELLPVRMLNEMAYCPRLFHLEWVGSEWAPNVYTADGVYQHRRVDQPDGDLAPDDDLLRCARAVEMSAPTEGLIAKMDLVELDGGLAVPVDTKRGKAPNLPNGAWDPERVQVCAQGLILRENGYTVDHAILYFAASRKRVRVDLTDDLIALTRDLTTRARALAEHPEPPPPLLDDPKCRGCSLVGICLPDEINTLRTGAGLTDAERATVRPLVVAHDDALPLYIQEHAARLGKRADVLQVRFKDDLLAEAPIRTTSQVVLLGNVSVSAQALHALCTASIPIVHASYYGWFYGLTHGTGHKNVERRVRQFRAADDPAACLRLATGLVNAKIKNARVLLRRNHPNPDPATLLSMKRLAATALTTDNLQSLLGIEGLAARDYFSHLPGMLKAPWLNQTPFRFETRNRRPPTDPVNALLSLGYALLTKDLTVTAASVGFDPYRGFYHQLRHGKPALALDLMEEFRPLIVDSAVLTALNNGEVRQEHFIARSGAVTLTPDGRKAFLTAYERRMSDTVRHPLFGYTLSYRRLLEVQLRLLDRYLLAEINDFPHFIVR